MRRFRLKKLEAHNKELNETLGYTAEGIEFSNGTCVLHWLMSLDYLAIYENIDVIEFKYGHSGKTIVEWVDSELNGAAINCDHLTLDKGKDSKNYLCNKCGEEFYGFE